jgi:murein DD-endopeptidase MepM/ murein hydrolase activator NlpD
MNARGGSRAGGQRGRPLPWPVLLLPLCPGALLPQAATIPPLPGAPHILTLARAPDSSIWAGTYGEGVFVLKPGAGSWEHFVPDTSSTSLSWGFVHAFGFAADGSVWYGTVGNGWGRSTDRGRTWTNWTFSALGPEYQYVAPDGIAFRGDTGYVATADGVKLSWDAGRTWRVVTDTLGARSARDSVWGLIRNQYVLALAAGPDGALWLSHLRGLERSRDGGRTWKAWPSGSARFRALLPLGPDSILVGTENALLLLDARLDALGAEPVPVGEVPPAVQQLAGEPGGIVAATPEGALPVWHGDMGVFSVCDPHGDFATSAAALPGGRWLVGTPRGLRVAGDSAARVCDRPARGAVALPAEPRHTWFERPLASEDQPYVDQTYRYGSTMGGNFQQHQGVEFNAGEGTPVHAVGDGVVMHAGPAEAGALTVAIRHDRALEVEGRRYTVYSVYYHNSRLETETGRRVRAGELISRVGNTGRATNEHLHLEVHATPVDSLPVVLDPAVRYPPYSTNPELWIEPLPGTGIVAGRVLDAGGAPVPQARVYGVVKPAPRETPYSFAETYGDRARGTPAYGEHFAVGDVPAGSYRLWVEIGGQRVERRVRVAPGMVTWVEFTP